MPHHDRYLDWHTGVRRIRSSGEWIPFLESSETDERMYGRERFGTREDAAVAAADLLTALRHGRDVTTDADAEDWSEEWKARHDHQAGGTPQG